MRHRFSILLLFVLAAPVYAQTQTPRTIAQEAIRRSLGTQLRPTDVTITGERREPDGTVLPVRIFIQGTRRARYEIGTGRSMQVSIYNNGAGWLGTGGAFRKLESQAAAMHRPAVLPFLDLLSEAEHAVTIVSDGALRQLGSGTAHRVQVRVPDPAPARRFRGIPIDEEANVFIDPTTFLVVRTERVVLADSNLEFRIPAATEYSDYRNVQGFAVPFRIVDLIGTPQLRIQQRVLTIQTITFNQGVPDSTFLP